jgi:hypothetical protein
MKVFSNSAVVLGLALLLVPPAVAQKSGGKGGGSHSSPSLTPSTNLNSGYKPTSTSNEFDPYPVTHLDSNPQQLVNEQPPCFHWPMNPLLNGTVSAKSMSIPPSALEKFSSGCASVRAKKFSQAEQDLMEAVKLAPKFSAAWALLGQVQEDQGQNEKAVQSCTTARDGDASYLPSYLCLADVAAHQEKWSDVAQLTDVVLGMHPVKAPSAYYYNCLANFYLKQFAAAEKSGLNALADGPKQAEAQVHWLLAKIYEEEDKRDLEAEQLREYLRLAPNAADSASVRQILKQIKPDSAADNH